MTVVLNPSPLDDAFLRAELSGVAASLAVGRRGAAVSIPTRAEVQQALAAWRKAQVEPNLTEKAGERAV
jgi:hypothetical protein